MSFLPYLGHTVLSTIVSMMTRHALTQSGKKPDIDSAGNSIGGFYKDNIMDLDELMDDIGCDNDTAGAIGDTRYDIIGDQRYDIVGDEDEELDEMLAELDVSGDDEDSVAGEEVEALVAGRGRRGRRGSRLKRQLMKKLLARRAAAVVDRGYSVRRRFPLGFAPTPIAAGATQNIPASPQNMFRPVRLVIPSDKAFDLNVTDVVVGTSQQFAQSASVPASVFSEVAINTKVTFDTAQIGNQISIGINNTSGGSITFGGAIIGDVVK